jgi:hypothetical protein
MFLALSNPYPALILVALAVAAYMFAALFWPPLRFIFRLKRFAASAVGVDEDGNRRLADGLALVLCPLIGVGALIAAGVLVVQWKNDAASRRRVEQVRAEQVQLEVNLAMEVLGEWELKDAYFDSRRREGLNDEGRKQVEGFVGELNHEFAAEWVKSSWGLDSGRHGNLKIEFVPAGGKNGHSSLELHPERGLARMRVFAPGAMGTADFVLELPDELKARMGDLDGLERIDLDAKRREENRRRNEEQKRLANYKEKAYSGTPVWKIRDEVMDLPEDQREAKKQEYVGMELDWEVQIRGVSEKDGRLELLADHSRPEPGESWPIFLDVDPGALPEEERPPKRMCFARIKGKVLSFEKGFRVELSGFELIEP